MLLYIALHQIFCLTLHLQDHRKEKHQAYIFEVLTVALVAWHA